MAQTTMYPAKVNSPPTTITSDIGSGDTTIPIAEASYLSAAPNIAFIGTDTTGETILYTGKSATSGAANLTGVTRGFQGTAKGWSSGTAIARNFTAYDHDTFKSNIEDLDKRAGPTTTNGTNPWGWPAFVIYVDAAATGAGDGTSWTDAFTTIQAAVDSLPDIIFSEVVIYVKSGVYNETVTFWNKSVVGDGYVFMWADKHRDGYSDNWATRGCEANTDPGKIVDSDVNFSSIRVGSRVHCVKYSGDIEDSYIQNYFVANVTSVGNGVCQTDEAVKVPTTGWNYYIDTVSIISDADSSPIVYGGNNSYIWIFGFHIKNTATPQGYGVWFNYRVMGYIVNCIIECTGGVPVFMYYGGGYYLELVGSYCKSTVSEAVCHYAPGYVLFRGVVLDSAVGFWPHGSVGELRSVYFDNCGAAGISSKEGGSLRLYNTTFSATCNVGIQALDGTTIVEYTTINNATTPRIQGTMDFHRYTEKTAPVSSDVLVIEDSADSYTQKKVLLSALIGQRSTGSSTGTGAEQTIAHGLGVTPTAVIVTPTATGATVTNVWADATNIHVTVTDDIGFNWSAGV
jgi:hypothetical protein